jgi:hypothetical protein
MGAFSSLSIEGPCAKYYWFGGSSDDNEVDSATWCRNTD